MRSWSKDLETSRYAMHPADSCQSSWSTGNCHGPAQRSTQVNSQSWWFMSDPSGLQMHCCLEAICTSINTASWQAH